MESPKDLVFVPYTGFVLVAASYHGEVVSCLHWLVEDGESPGSWPIEWPSLNRDRRPLRRAVRSILALVTFALEIRLSHETAFGPLLIAFCMATALSGCATLVCDSGFGGPREHRLENLRAARLCLVAFLTCSHSVFCYQYRSSH